MTWWLLLSYCWNQCSYFKSSCILCSGRDSWSSQEQNMSLYFVNLCLSLGTNSCFALCSLFTFTSASTICRVTAADYVYQGLCMGVWVSVRGRPVLCENNGNVISPQCVLSFVINGIAQLLPHCTALLCNFPFCYYMHALPANSTNTAVHFVSFIFLFVFIQLWYLE